MTDSGKKLFKKAFGPTDRDEHLKIYKYNLPINDRVEIPLPIEDGYAKILCVQTQPNPGNPEEDQICLWAVVDLSYKGANGRAFYVVGTGHPFPVLADPDKYIGTVQLKEGLLVFHVFEER